MSLKPARTILAFVLAGLFLAAVGNAQAVSEPPNQTLDTVRVKAKSEIMRSKAHPTKYDLFLERKAYGNGTFMTREQIDAKVTTRIQSLFSSIPGIKVRQSGTAWDIRSQRCGRSNIRGSNVPGSNSSDTGPMVFVDGHAIGGTGELDLYRPGEIEAIEIYQGASQVPAEAKGRACFAIFLWTRSP